MLLSRAHIPSVKSNLSFQKHGRVNLLEGHDNGAGGDDDDGVDDNDMDCGDDDVDGDDEKQETKNWNLLMLRAVCASAKINADRQS